jgi:hypothetical protein
VPRPRYHLASSTALGLALGGGRKLAAVLVSGFFVDFDHLLDFTVGRGKWIILPLHGWEYVPVWLLIDRRLRLGGALVGSYVLHLAIDQVWNDKRSPLAYFLTYRASKRFREDELGPVDPVERHRWRRSSLLGLLRWF